MNKVKKCVSDERAVHESGDERRSYLFDRGGIRDSGFFEEVIQMLEDLLLLDEKT